MRRFVKETKPIFWSTDLTTIPSRQTQTMRVSNKISSGGAATVEYRDFILNRAFLDNLIQNLIITSITNNLLLTSKSKYINRTGLTFKEHSTNFYKFEI